MYAEIKEDSAKNLRRSYREISRAQIHGYDINALALLHVKTECPDMIVCGADEKVIRLLEPIPHFINYFNALTGHELNLNIDNEEERNVLLQSNPKIYKTMMESG